MLEARDLKKSFGGIHAADGLSLELRRGEVTGLIGPNGAGKTTVFNLLTRAVPPDGGTVKLLGQDDRSVDAEPHRTSRACAAPTRMCGSSAA